MKNKKFIISIFLAVLSFSAFSLDGLLRDSTFYIKHNIKDFSEDLIKGNIEKGVLVNPSPLDLKVGDIFIDVDGGAKRVVSITRTGKNISIKTEKPEILDVMDYVDIPDQELDLIQLIPTDSENNAKSIANDSDSMQGKGIQEKKLLDDFLPSGKEGIMSVPFSIKVSNTFGKDYWTTKNPLGPWKKVLEYSSYSQEERDSLSEDIKKYEDKMHKALSFDAGINGSVRWKTNYSKAKTSAHLATVKVDKRGTWKFWKWRFYEQKGHVLFEHLKDTEFGFELTATGGISRTVDIPFWAVSTGAAGIYFSVGLELGYSGAINIGGSYYTRDCSYDYAHTDFNLALIPSGAEKYTHKWSPNASEFDLYGLGEGKAQVYAKTGLRLLKLTFIELRGNIGASLDGYAGYRRRSVYYDEKGYNDYINNLPKDATFDGMKKNYADEMQNLKQKSAVNRGLANITGKVFANAEVTILTFIKSKILSIEWVFLHDEGFHKDTFLITSPYKKGED